jgi:AraC-like DNA-binding protein
MNHYAKPADFKALPKEGVVHSHFDVQTHARQSQLLAWRDRVGHVIDVLPTRSEVEEPFSASIDRYRVGELVFTDARTETMRLERSLARISRDSMRDFAFHVFLEGDVADVTVRSSSRAGGSTAATILAVDLGQPVRMRRNACRVLTIFVPVALAAEVFPDPEAIHGRMMRNETPLTNLIFEHVGALGRDVSSLDAGELQSAIRTGADLLVAAFGKQAGLSGNARAAARAAMFGRVRRYIQANLRDADLSPESVVHALQLPRPSVYRLFQHEGGLGAYIRHLRLRQAAHELAHCRYLTVTEIAYGLGFASSSDFTRAFRRAYGLAPRDFREASAEPASALIS